MNIYMFVHKHTLCTYMCVYIQICVYKCIYKNKTPLNWTTNKVIYHWKILIFLFLAFISCLKLFV